MNGSDRDLTNELDRPATWIDRRVRVRRYAAGTWLATTTATGLLALLSDSFLFAPVLPSLAAGLWLTGQWSVVRWWRARSRHAGHPIVWAHAPWTLVMGRPVPDGWHDKGVPGTLHHAAEAWVWKPSALFAENLPPRRWPHQHVAVATVTPLWGVLSPHSAQLRLYLRSGGTVDLLVLNPSSLGTLTTTGTDVAR